jgi:hypothetical protein
LGGNPKGGGRKTCSLCSRRPGAEVPRSGVFRSNDLFALQGTAQTLFFRFILYLVALYACGTIVSTHLDLKTFEMRDSLRRLILLAEPGWQRVIVQTRHLHLDPPTLNPIIDSE